MGDEEAALDEGGESPDTVYTAPPRVNRDTISPTPGYSAVKGYGRIECRVVVLHLYSVRGIFWWRVAGRGCIQENGAPGRARRS